MADDLTNLSALVEDQILVLNIIRGLNQCFEHVGSIIRCYSSFLNLLKVRDDLLLEEIHMDNTGPPAAPIALYTNVASLAAKPPSSTPSHLPNGKNGGTGGHRNKYNNKIVIAIMTPTITARTTTAAETVVALLARPPPPLVPMAGPTHHG
jgi:hypothetical protein